MKIIFPVVSLSITIQLAYSQNIPQDSLIRTGKLANGLTYLIRRNLMPKGQADFHLVQQVGSVFEEDDQRGLAHFLEHMAFNGTKNFPGNTLITELGSKGVKFGSNINAYTSYDETVYRLTDVPLSTVGVLDTALLVLHDWCGSILNEDKDIDEERAVIQQEWRTRSSGYSRVQDGWVIPSLLKGTVYANRLPIGSMDIVMNFKHEQLRKYYRKWYRPDLQGIIIVGDIDVDLVENKIKKLFNPIPAPINPALLPDFRVPEWKEPIIVVASDAEIPNASATVYWRQSPVHSSPVESVQHFKMGIINQIISNLINQRFSDLKDSRRSWNSLSIMGTYSIAKHIPAWTLDLNVPNNQILEPLKADLIEMERIKRYGFSKNELDPTIRQFHLLNNETDYFDRGQLSNAELAEGLKKQFLKGEILPGQYWKYQMTKKVLNELSVDSLNFYIKHYISSSSLAVAILWPAKTALSMPSNSSILNVLEEVKKAKLSPYIKVDRPSAFTNLAVTQGGRIIKTEAETVPFGFTKWEMSNGVKVWFKNTGYQESKVLLFGFKTGGYSQVSLNNLPAAIAYNEVIKGASGLEGALGVDFKSEINPYAAYIVSSGYLMNLKLLLQNLYIRMTSLKDEPQTFETWKINQLAQLKSRGTLPKDVFGDSLRMIMNHHHPRAIFIKKESIIKAIYYQQIKDLHQQFFGNAKGFNFVIVGHLNIDTVKLLAERWLGALPANAKSNSKIVDHQMYPPQGVIKKQFSTRMGTPQSTITIGYTGMMPHSYANRLLMASLADILRTRYLREIREKEGGSYGVSVRGEIFDVPKGHFIFQINFDTAPDPVKKKRLLEIVYREIEKIRRFGPDSSEMNTVIKADLKNELEFEKNRNANYWLNKQGLLLQYGKDFGREMSEIVLEKDRKKLQNFAGKVFGKGNLIEVIMDPE